MAHKQSILVIGLFLVWRAATSSAAIVQLSGGDPSDGLTLTASNVIYAIAPALSNHTNPGAVQGVTFAASDPNVSISGDVNDYIGAGTFDAGQTSANDTRLLTLVNDARYNGPSTITGTVSGLTPLTSYILDYLLTDSSGANFTREVTISSAGAGPAVTDDITPATVNGVVYDIHQLVQADNAGVISFTDTAGQPFPNAIISELVVSSVPEPSALGILALGAIALTARRVRRFNAMGTPSTLRHCTRL